MASIKDEYMARITAIFEEHNQSKLSSVNRLLSKYRYNEHELYTKICAKYGISPEEKYNGPDPDAEPESDDPFASEDEDPFADDADDDNKDENKDDEDEKVEVNKYGDFEIEEPVAWQLVFRQTSPNQGGDFVKPGDFQLNEDKPESKNYSNFKLLETEVKNADGEYRFKLRFPNEDEEKKDLSIIWKQTSSPLEEEVDGFVGQKYGLSTDFAGLYKSEDAECICQSSDGFELGVGEEHSDGISDRGLKGPHDAGEDEVLMAHVVELYVAAPAVARLPLVVAAEDLEGGPAELVGAAKCEDGSLLLNGKKARGFVKIPNDKVYGTMKKKFSVCLWFQQHYKADAQLITKGPWRKAFSMGVRHTRGVGNVLRYSISGQQGQDKYDHTIKDWSKFPELADKELQKLIEEEKDTTWHHAAMTLGDNKVKFYYNGEMVKEKSFHGNAINRNKDIFIGAEATDSQGTGFFAGRIYDVCIFPGELGQAGIKQIMESGRGRQSQIAAAEAERAEKAKAAQKKGPSNKFLAMQRRMAARKR